MKREVGSGTRIFCKCSGQHSMVHGCKNIFCLGPGSTKTVIHVRYNGAIVEHLVPIGSLVGYSLKSVRI